VGINCQSGFCLCLSGDRDGRGMAPSTFRRERPRMRAASGHRWDVTRGQWVVEGTFSHLSSPWRMPTLAASLAPDKPRIWPLVQLF
jgi:hypothetical protein